MTAKIITVTSGKGGVGKTTATANIAVALAQIGQRVVCLDADIGLRNLDVVMGLENRIVYDLVDVIEGRCRLKQAMIRDKRFDELHLIPAAQTRDKNAISPSDMVKLGDELREEADWVIIDSPPASSAAFATPLPRRMRSWLSPIGCLRGAGMRRIIGLIEANRKNLPNYQPPAP